MTLPSTQVFFNLAHVFNDTLNKDDDNMITFQVKDTLVSYVNTLRRMILTGVESVAFNSKMNEQGKTTDVDIRVNTTPMTNEMLADRIGLIPLHIENPEDWNPDRYVFRLKVSNEEPTTMTVTAADIGVYRVGKPGDTDILDVEAHKQIFRPDPITGDQPIIAVLKGKQPNTAAQSIEFVARATVGTGREHIRWSPVCQASYGYSIDTNEERQREFFERWLENTKKLSLSKLNEDTEKKEAMIREFQTMEVQRCFKVNEKGEPISFDFMVESIGTLPVETIIERALYNLEKKCSLYSGELPDTVRVQPADARMKGFDFLFPGEDHTLGNLLQSWMEANLMDSKEITFVGYKVPHPLRDEMVVRVGVDFPEDPELDGKETTARNAIAKASAECAIMFRTWREDWNRLVLGGAGSRTRASLKPNVGNAKALEEAVSRVVATRVVSEGEAKAAKQKRVPQASAFYAKYIERQEQKRAVPLEAQLTPRGIGSATKVPTVAPTQFGTKTPNFPPPLTPTFPPTLTEQQQQRTPEYGSHTLTTSGSPPFVPQGATYYTAWDAPSPVYGATTGLSPNYSAMTKQNNTTKKENTPEFKNE